MGLPVSILAQATSTQEPPWTSSLARQPFGAHDALANGSGIASDGLLVVGAVASSLLHPAAPGPTDPGAGNRPSVPSPSGHAKAWGQPSRELRALSPVRTPAILRRFRGSREPIIHDGSEHRGHGNHVRPHTLCGSHGITASPNPSSTAAAHTRILKTMSGLTQSVDQVASSMSQLADVITASANPSSTATSSTRRRSFKG